MDLLQYILKIQSIAKVGKLHSKDLYALDSYDELEKISKEMLQIITNTKLERDNYYERDVYPTPNISVRVIVKHNDKYLFVKEKADNKYCVPGGWCEVFSNLSQNAIDEVYQESGYIVEIDDILAIFNRGNDINTSISEYAVFLSATIIDKEDIQLTETKDPTFYARDEIPCLSYKNDARELDIAFDVIEGKRKPYFD